MVAIMSVLAVCLLLGVALIVASQKADGVAAGALNRQAERTALAEQFRRDVAGAETAPDQLGELTAGPTTLILALPGGTRVVYAWDKGVLQRTERVGGRDASRPVPVGAASARVEFVRTADGRVVTLRIHETPKA